jgi:hypothetical protein
LELVKVMCDVTGPFKLCTCESSVDESKPHWVLHRYLQNKEEIQIMGLYNQPDPYTMISERSLQRRMNSIMYLILNTLILRVII